MQNFPNSPASLPPGFTRGSPYPPHPSDPQISPRTTEDYVAMHQSQPNPQSHGQHLLLRGQHHAGQAAHIHGYGSRRGTGEMQHSGAHSGGGGSSYRKENMDYYFAMSGRDRNRRGGVGYSAGYGYSNMDGHLPHQYRHASGSGSSSGMMSPYPLDYGPGSGGSSSNSTGAGSFSPSQQYGMSQNPSMQQVTGPQILQRQHGQKYPSHQGLHQGQQLRGYPVSAHRMPPQFSHYSPLNTPAGSGIYSPPPQRYDGSSIGGMDTKMNNSPTHSNPNPATNAAAPNSAGQQEGVGQSYPSSNHPPYSPQSHALNKHPAHSQRTPQHSLGAGYDASIKMQHHTSLPGLAYPKHPQSNVPSSAAMPHLPSQEISKSPMHSQNQQAHINQNFSPISNPSPAPSAVQSPSCSSSSSPLMGVSDGQGSTTASHVQPPSHSTHPNSRSSHSHGRLLQTVPQLSPTPNSNSSISSCGSSVGSKSVSLNAGLGSGHSALNSNRMGMGSRGGSREDSSSSLYPSCPQDKMMQDPGLNSLNALTSQVANLPNTVQHMLLTDTLLSQKKGKDSGHHSQMQHAAHAVSASQTKGKGVSAGLDPGAGSEDSGTVGADLVNSEAEEATRDQGDHSSLLETKRMRQMSGTSSESETTSYYPSSMAQNQMQPQAGQSRHGMHLQVDTAIAEASVKQSSSQSSTPLTVAQTKTPETQTPSSSSPHSIPPSAQPSPNQPPCPPAPSDPSSSTPSPTHSLRSNCLAEPDAANLDDKNGAMKQENKDIRDERSNEEKREHERSMAKNSQNLDNETEELSEHGKLKESKKDIKKNDAQQCDNPNKNLSTSEAQNVGGVGVIVSARPDLPNPESTKHPEATPTSPQYGISQHPSQLNYPEEKHAVNVFRDSRNHNGEGDACMDSYPDFGQNMSSNHTHPGPFKYGNPELVYNACMGSKNRGRVGPGGGLGANSRYPGYHQPHPNYGTVPRKDAGVDGSMKRGAGIIARGQENNSQLQQPFPSLLQEVLQGYHLDRRYGRSEQVPGGHHPPQNISQHQYGPRHPYGMMETMRSHGMGSQSSIGSAGVHHAQMASGKSQILSQSHGAGADIGPGLTHASWDSEAQKVKSSSSEKSKIGMSPSHSSQGQQSSDSTGTPPKHINLADYSLPHRKPSNLSTPSSAVQQLLLQETEPLVGSAGPIGQNQSQTSLVALSSSTSGRRSVICDVSPSRRTTPERERGQTGPSGASVIQQPHTSATNEQVCIKEEVKDKREQELEGMSNEPAGRSADSHSGVLTKDTDIQEHNKPLQPSADTNSDLHSTKGAKGSSDIPSPYHSQQLPPDSVSNPLSSPSRRQSYPQGVDGSAAAYAAYGFSESRDENPKLNTHYPPHHPYHALSSQSTHLPSANKLQTYPHSISHQHPHNLDDRLEWTAHSNRHKEISVHSTAASDRHLLQSQSEQKIQSTTDVLPNPQHLHRQLSYPGSYYDMKVWEGYSDREGAGMSDGDSFRRSQQLPTAVPPESVAPQPSSVGPKNLDVEESVKPLHPPPTTSNSVSSAGHNTNNMNPVTQPAHRQGKTGASGETNPLMMRRRVRSFISPIPAKRQHQDFANQRSGQSYHSNSPHPESRNPVDGDPSNNDPGRSRLTSPNSPYTPSANSFAQSSSPPQSKTKILPPRKGRGLKLEAIVQKITPNMKKVSNYNSSSLDSDPNYFSEVSQYGSDIQDSEIGAPYSRVHHGESLSYLDEAHSLEDLMPYRAAEETFACDSQVLKQSTPGSTSGSLRSLQTDFDFGLGATGSSGSGVGDGDKDDLRIPSDFTLLGPLPPPPPLPRPVQGSPPPSSSALSDIQQFTNTYQQLETRRGEQSAANLLRQKLQETGMGFDDYAGGDYYGATPPHHSPGHHLLSRTPQHQMVSARMTGADSKQQESIVPKGYFPSGKKKGRPVGSVNKQKRTQVQMQNVMPSAPAPPQSAPVAPAAPQIVTTASVTSEAVTAAAAAAAAAAAVAAAAVSASTDQKPCPSLVPPAQPQSTKVDVESEDTQAEMDVKPIRHKQKKSKDGNEGVGLRGRQRRRRRGVSGLESQSGSGGSVGGTFPETRSNVFAPYIHVERKVAEIGAVCTIVNAEEEKLKCERSGGVGGKGSGTDSLTSISLSSQLLRKEKETEKVKEKRTAGQVDSSLQTGKALPTSGYVLPGPVISETSHTGRLLCCLCQKWANYKNLGDLYGPFYPSDYATKFPKSQPQIRQTQTNPGVSITNISSNSTESSTQDSQSLDPPNIKSSTDSDCTVSQTTNPTSPATTVGTASPTAGEEMPFLLAKSGNTATTTPVQNWDRTSELTGDKVKQQTSEVEIGPKQQEQQQSEDVAQRPQHRKLTSHPRFKRRHKSSEDLPRTIPINSKASLPFQPPPPSLDSLGPLAQLAQLPQVPLDPEELWVHEGCIVWASGVYLVNGRLYGLQEALDGARDTSCSHCEMVGSTLGCYSKGCTLRYHYLCAMEADCSLNEDNFSLRCPKHKFPQSVRPVKAGTAYLEQSERG
ncbi:transcription factor 20 [Chanos chanos]|uniref:Transcription factor 20 n=1 Tax=Chanos chanos TaxID=29144 RepID=A0A6J2WYM3_CHACN|nr:transcription factor 20 [Chanos chanos]